MGQDYASWSELKKTIKEIRGEGEQDFVHTLYLLIFWA